jgi:hypothetical protein
MEKIKDHQNGGLLFWQGHLCNLRIDTMCDLLLFGKDVKVFLAKI